MARVIAVCNQKGGVGKTTTSVNLSAYLAALGRRVLIVDFDPQANATSALMSSNPDSHVYHGLVGKKAGQEIIKPTQILGYHLIPSSSDLSGALVELVNLPQREYYLRNFINSIRHQYDYIIIDLPPSLSLLTINGLMASDEIIIPVQAEYYGMEGLGQLLKTIDLIRDNLSHPIKITGAVITLYDKRERLPRQVAKSLRRNFPYPIFNVEIPRSVHLAEAPSFSQPILIYSPNSPGALAYKRLAEELIATEQQHGGVGSPDFNV